MLYPTLAARQKEHTMKKNILLLVNPNSGRGLSSGKLGDIVYRLALAGYNVTTRFTEKGRVPELAKKNGGKYPLLACVGGDGTLSEAVAGLMELDVKKRPVLGYIPNGTANDMATTLALSSDVAEAVDTILFGETIPLDIGRFNGGYFTYIAAFGAFTSVSYNTSQQAKKALGHFAYVLGGIGELSAIKPRRTIVEYDGGVIDDSFIFGAVTNSTSVAGVVRLNESVVDLSDGKFEVMLIKNPMSIQELFEIMSSLSSRSYDSDNIKLLHTSTVRFTFEEPVPWTRDGENGGEHMSLDISNCPRAITIIKRRQEQSLTEGKA